MIRIAMVFYVCLFQRYTQKKKIVKRSAEKSSKLPKRKHSQAVKTREANRESETEIDSE